MGDKRIMCLALAAVNMATVELEKFYDGLSANDAAEVGRVLDGLAQRAAYAAGYVGWRVCGNSDVRAERQAARALRKVRGALGYTHP